MSSNPSTPKSQEIKQEALHFIHSCCYLQFQARGVDRKEHMVGSGLNVLRNAAERTVLVALQINERCAVAADNGSFNVTSYG